MAWIEVHQSLLTHRKTLRLCRLLKMDKYAVTGRLMALWCWALDNAPDGILPSSDVDILGDVMGWEGDPLDLVDALGKAGFLDPIRADEPGFAIHDWNDYAGKLVEQRQANAAKQKAFRERKKQTLLPSHNDDVTVTLPLRTRSTVPYSTVPNHSLHPTKERLENKYKHGGKDGSAHTRAPTNHFLKKSKDESEIIRQLPPHVVEQFAPEQIQEEAKKAAAWYSNSEREHPMPLDMEHLKNWLLRIPAAQRQKPNETDVERLGRILASWDRIKNEKGLVDGLTWNSWNDRLQTARETEKIQRRQEALRAAAALYPEEADVVQQNGAHPPPTNG